MCIWLGYVSACGARVVVVSPLLAVPVLVWVWFGLMGGLSYRVMLVGHQHQ